MKTKIILTMFVLVLGFISADSYALLSTQTDKTESKEEERLEEYSSNRDTELIELEVLDKYLNSKLRKIFTAIENLSERFSDIEQKLSTLNSSVSKMAEKIDDVINKPQQEVKMEFR